MTAEKRHTILILVALLAIIPLAVLERGRVNSAGRESALSFNPPEGYYRQDFLLRVEYPNPDVRIIYTLDGSQPSLENGQLYTQPIPVNIEQSTAVVVRARVFLSDGNPGPVAGANYLNADVSLPVLSLVAEPDDLWDAEKGIYSHPSRRGIEWERPVEVTYLDHNHQLAFHVPAGLRIHGNSTRRIEKKSLRLYFRQEYGLNRLSYPLFVESGLPGAVELDLTMPEAFKRLVVHDGGQDFAYPNYGANWTMIRTQLMNELANQVDFPTTQSQPALLFLNGELQGIYLIRNYADRWYLADEYGVQEIPLEQSKIRWDYLLAFIEANDLGDPDNYAYVQSQVDVDNLIDYFVLQMYATDTDWLYTNVKRFLPDTQGGRWNYLFWDVDYSFGLAPWTDYDFDMVDYVFNAERPGLEKEANPFRRLMENQDFRNAFLARTADLLNTSLAPDRVKAHIDVLADELRPAIQLESALWSSPGDWEASVAYLREFANKRPDFFRQHLIEHLDLGGVFRITFNPPAAEQGWLAVDDVLLGSKPWEGAYFQGFELDVQAAPAPGYCFAGWTVETDDPEAVVELASTPQLLLTVDQSMALTPVFEPAQRESVQPGDVTITKVRLDDEAAGGDWIELRVNRPGGVDLRGWRLTDNDTKAAGGEGSLIFTQHASLADVPNGTTVFVVIPQAGLVLDKADDLSVWDGRMILHAGNDQLEYGVDRWFDLVAGDNLVLLSPGAGPSYKDDRGVAFMNIGDYNHSMVTSASFGVLVDGVTTGMKTIDP
ncbi:MAG: CotH kinase family protein [Anaerolineales bacterium]|nr:CotH kinase family protein [Anaerolineales bacterium]